jgi:hypothetical protein
MANILIAAVVALAMSALVLLVWRMGLNFSRKDRFGVGRALNKRFGMRSRARYGWVRDVMYDSKIKLFRCNEVFTKKASPFSKNKSEATPTVGMIAEAPDGEDIVVETSGTEVRLAHTLKLRTDMRTDYRTAWPSILRMEHVSPAAGPTRKPRTGSHTRTGITGTCPSSRTRCSRRR